MSRDEQLAAAAAPTRLFVNDNGDYFDENGDRFDLEAYMASVGAKPPEHVTPEEAKANAEARNGGPITVNPAWAIAVTKEMTRVASPAERRRIRSVARVVLAPPGRAALRRELQGAIVHVLRGSRVELRGRAARLVAPGHVRQVDKTTTLNPNR
jgi:hypothetical protein